MHRWHIGDTTITRIEDLNFAIESDRPVPDWCVPDLAPSNGEVGIAFSILAIESEGVRIVVDPWLANDGPRDEPGASERAARLLGELGAAGFPPDEVDVVVNTHLDGIGWNTRPSADGGWSPSFPNARYLYPDGEVTAIERGDDINGREGFAELASMREIERVVPPMSLTSSVSLTDAPGHNAGHLAVRVDSDSSLAIYAGHLFLTPFQLGDLESLDDSESLRTTAAATRRSLLGELAEREGVLLTTLLGGSGGGTVFLTDDGYALRPSHAG
jgi:glyoxylase-like metal-dependent hydrolase (beta-lactamase superfamily II)